LPRDALVFPTTRGRKESASNVRNRLLRPAVERANAALIEGGRDRLPERLTPHSLRHTSASLLVGLGEDPGYVMDQMGHTDPTFTLRVYRKAIKRRDGEPDLLRALVGAEATTLPELNRRAARPVPEEAANL
jgi:integrase